MATSVYMAFSEFQKNLVNLEKARTDDARSSRNWLIDKINGFADADENFPLNYTEIDIGYGSFARRTKIRPLDDIDLMFGLHADNCTYGVEYDKVTMTAHENTSRLKRYRHDSSNLISSVKILNAYKSKLQSIPQYEKSEIKRNQEAVTLKLTTKLWNFDIVPCFLTKEDIFGKSYYLIPDGKGHWKKTDPRIDKNRVTDINVKLGGNMLNVIRMVKYWQRRKTMPTMNSYLLETIILNYYSGKTICSEYVDIELEALFKHIGFYVNFAVDDQKNIQGDINTLSTEDRVKIANKCYSDAEKVNNARRLENEKDHEGSIKIWREVLGSEFPNYG